MLESQPEMDSQSPTTGNAGASGWIASRWTPVVVSIGAFVLQMAWCWPYTMDDSFISFRYAKHIGDGVGPVWNLMDPDHPVEGFTSFLHVWLMGLVRLVTSADLVMIGKWVGVAAGTALAAAVVREARRLDLRGGSLWVAVSVLWLPYVALNTVDGMETPLALLWTFLTTLACVRLVDGETNRPAWAFAAYGLLGTLTRPEFALSFGLMAAYAWWRAPQRRPKLYLAVAALYVLPGVVITLWRLHYYGDFVPNAFHVKQKHGVQPAGLMYVGSSLTYCALPYLLFMISGGRALWDRRRTLISIVLLSFGATSAYFTTTVPLMGWWYRFLLPHVPGLALCAALALHERRRSARALRAIATALLVLLPAAHMPNVAKFLVFHKGAEDLYREVGRRIRPLAAPDRWLYFYDVGSLVYESEWNVIDQVGLNTRRRDLASPCRMKPDVILSGSPNTTPPPVPCDDLYKRLTVLPWLEQLPETDNSLHVFVRQDIDYGAELKLRLEDHWPGPFRRPTDWLVKYQNATLFLRHHVDGRAKWTESR